MHAVWRAVAVAPDRQQGAAFPQLRVSQSRAEIPPSPPARKQNTGGGSGKTQAAAAAAATPVERDRSPLVVKSNVRRSGGRDGKASGGSVPHYAASAAASSSSSSGRAKPGLSPRLGTALLLAALAGFLHWYHLTLLFENDRHFSHLSNLEKEMAFRTEMGLYYSYYKTIIEAPSFLSGLYLVMNDQLTEYPLVINTLKRFNLYPEVVLASGYRTYTGLMDFLGVPTKMCWSINRGEGLAPVDSCEGLGDPAYFYVTFVFLLNGFMMSLFFMYGAYLRTPALALWHQHVVSTRVMWTPPLRESFAYPFLVMQMLLLTYILRTKSPSRTSMVTLGVATLCFMLPWQFAQFVLLTQVASLFASYILGYLSPTKLQSILVTHMMALAVCFLLMFGNSMLLTSFYASSLLSIWVSQRSAGAVIAFRDRFTQVFRPGIITWTMQGLAWVGFTVVLKFLLSNVLGSSDDAHISGLIKSKFTSYQDFHTLIPELIAKGELVYHGLQLVAFSVLAILIMRLKLFLTPHMCIMAALVCSKQLFGWVGERSRLQLVVFALLSIMAVQGVANLQAQWGIMGEFSNVPQEELLDWIQGNTKPDAVFAGAMPTMASVKLSTGRAIVNHPHYEDAGLRERTKMVYSMYSRMSGETVKSNLMQLGVQYFVLEDSWCTRRTRPGCSMPEIWDVEDPQNAGKVPFCSLVTRDARPHFNTVFHNSIYKVLKVPR
ncbi:hypothetical protein CRUP_001560 [Coryphaenoides rupestris]|nr:hypothetical protein CRUP_001560 [Coryphaenoides rupestris]